MHHPHCRFVHTHPAAGDRVVDHSSDHLIDPVAAGGTESIERCRGHVRELQNPCSDGVGHIVRQIGDAIGVAAQETLRSRRRRIDSPGVGSDPVEYLEGEVLRLEERENPDAVDRMKPVVSHIGGQRLLAGVAKGRMTDVMTKTDRLRQVTR